MRSAGNFSPEWGYLAPAPSFMRTARVVLVATAVGATAGAAFAIHASDCFSSAFRIWGWNAGGACVAIFRPPVLSNCRQERHLCYVWDGHAITSVYEKRSMP